MAVAAGVAVGVSVGGAVGDGVKLGSLVNVIVMAAVGVIPFSRVDPGVEPHAASKILIMNIVEGV